MPQIDIRFMVGFYSTIVFGLNAFYWDNVKTNTNVTNCSVDLSMIIAPISKKAPIVLNPH